MLSCFSSLRYKEVIDVHSGFRLGYVFDGEFDEGGQIQTLITPGKAKLFGSLGREDDYIIPWSAIVRIGTDIILVDHTEPLSRRKRKKSSWF